MYLPTLELLIWKGHGRRSVAVSASCLHVTGPQYVQRSMNIASCRVDWGSKANKPGKLVQWKHNGIGRTVHAFAGNEKGMLYYCSKLFADSFIRRQLLQAGVSTADLYARVPLLLTPSEHLAILAHGGSRRRHPQGRRWQKPGWHLVGPPP